MANEVIGVAASISRVCFSRSRLIEPAVAIVARKTTTRVSSMSTAAKMPWPIGGRRERRAAPEARRVGALHHELHHPGEGGEQDQVAGQDGERPPAAHPAAEFLDADRTDRRRPSAGAGRMSPGPDGAGPRGRRGRRRRGRDRPGAVSTGAMSTVTSRVGSVTSVTRHPLRSPNGSASWPVTWRKSSSRSVAARAKLTIGSPAATDVDEEPGGGGVVAAEAEFDGAVVEDRRGRHVRRRPRRRLARPRGPRPRRGRGPAGRRRTGVVARCR